MKKFTFLLIGLLTAFGLQAQHTHIDLENDVDSVSYAIGMNIASSMKSGGIDSLNFEAFVQAVQDVMIENHAMMDAANANMIVQNFVKKKQEEAAKDAIQVGIDFLAENAKNKDVHVTPSGLQYKVIRQGDGPIPTLTSNVTTHYHGTLLNGKVFDSSYEKGKPLNFNVTGVIKGWTEALQMMPVGSKWILYIPQDLAYGSRAMGPKIPPYSTLIFEIELLSIN